LFQATGTRGRKRRGSTDDLDDPILDNRSGIMAVLLEPQDPDEID
jgi:hypothetical protein